MSDDVLRRLQRARAEGDPGADRTNEKKLDDACAVYRRAHELSPAAYDPYYKLQDLLRRLGRAKELTELQRAWRAASDAAHRMSEAERRSREDAVRARVDAILDRARPEDPGSPPR